MTRIYFRCPGCGWEGLGAILPPEGVTAQTVAKFLHCPTCRQPPPMTILDCPTPGTEDRLFLLPERNKPRNTPPPSSRGRGGCA